MVSSPLVRYDADYYYGISDYRRSFKWLVEWGRIAVAIVDTLHPHSVLDAGCAHGMLVESLRDLGVEAFGIDISEYAISQAREDIKEFLRVRNLTERYFDQYGLITCIEVMEHLTEPEGKIAVANLCKSTYSVLFSSTPNDFTEPTHQNVQPKEYWIGLFKENGFKVAETYNARFISEWAFLVQKE